MAGPALFGGIMIGAAAWLEVFIIFFIAPVTWQLAVIPGLFFLAGLFLAGTFGDEAHFAELAIGGICIAVAVGFVGWFYLTSGGTLLIAGLLSLGAGVLILVGLVFVLGGPSKGY
ncbi:MAG: hypothetical protein ACFFD8_02580 [Candidatus Thorarchaeota archaeon]